MAALSASVASSAISSAFFSPASSSSLGAKPISCSSNVNLVFGVPALKKPLVKVSSSSRCTAGDHVPVPCDKSPPPCNAHILRAAVSVAAAAAAAAHPAVALVDERLSTEGTGLSLGLSNPLLIWILLGVATLVWALFFTYSSNLPEGDDDSGLAL